MTAPAMMPFVPSAPPPLLASLPEFPGLGESLKFQLNGLIVVFTALILIWSLVELMGWAFRAQARAAARKLAVQPAVVAPVPAPAQAVAVAPVVAGPAPETIAVVTAAVHVFLAGTPHRIRGIAPISLGADWAREGRRTIFASHQPR
ncbi:MAG TPA: OadG family transporter subunit [Opitutus sp.]|nr:OadG family transporter subunit [Opitutus sp.]